MGREVTADPAALSVPPGRIEKMDPQPRRHDGRWAAKPGPAESGVPLNATPEPAAVWVDVLTGLYPHLDTIQAADLWDRLVTRESEWGTNWAPEEPEKFESWCRSQAGVWTEHRPTLLALATDPPADPREARALTEVIRCGKKATAALAAQTSMVAGLHHVSLDVAAARIDALRAQYATDLSHLPDGQRPDPPADWVHGFTSRDYVARQSPGDAATLYAIYRGQCDPTVFDETDPDGEYAVVDLETASPPMGAWFKPHNGHIIEVGVVVTDREGIARTTYEQLVRPTQDFLDAYGTGAVDIHQITPDALNGAPEWVEAAPQVADALAGRVLVAHNVDYETTWLTHHFGVAGVAWDPAVVPMVDTLRLAQQHDSLAEHHHLDTVCAALDVEYTDGHRALHDAQVTARALTALREQVQARYADNPRFAGLPSPR